MTHSLFLLIVGSLVSVGTSRTARSQGIDSLEREGARGLRTASVAVIGDGGPLVAAGGFSAPATAAALELEFRKAGIPVIPQDKRDSTGAVLMIMIKCSERTPTCALSASLTRVLTFGPKRTRMAGEVWSSGPTLLTTTDWERAATAIRQWSVDNAILAANLLLAAR